MNGISWAQAVTCPNGTIGYPSPILPTDQDEPPYDPRPPSKRPIPSFNSQVGDSSASFRAFSGNLRWVRFWEEDIPSQVWLRGAWGDHMRSM